MCNPLIIGQLGTALGSVVKYQGEKKGLQATEDVLDREKENQKRLQDDNLNTSLNAAAATAPGTGAPPVSAPAQDSSALGQALAATTGNGDARFTGDVGRTVTAQAGVIDRASRVADLRRLYGLSQQEAERRLDAAGMRINANNSEAAYAMGLLPQQLQAAGAQGRGFRMAGSILAQLGKGSSGAGAGTEPVSTLGGIGMQR